MKNRVHARAEKCCCCLALTAGVQAVCAVMPALRLLHSNTSHDRPSSIFSIFPVYLLIPESDITVVQEHNTKIILRF